MVDAGDRVVVNCAAGLNRSGLIVGRALIALGHEPAEVVELIREARGPRALFNRTFERFLLERCCRAGVASPSYIQPAASPSCAPGGGEDSVDRFWALVRQELLPRYLEENGYEPRGFGDPQQVSGRTLGGSRRSEDWLRRPATARRILAAREQIPNNDLLGIEHEVTAREGRLVRRGPSHDCDRRTFELHVRLAESNTRIRIGGVRLRSHRTAAGAVAREPCLRSEVHTQTRG